MKKLLFFLSILSIFVLAGCDLLRPPEVKHTLDASASAGGTIYPSGKIEVLDGADQTFIFGAFYGFEVDYIVITDKYGQSQNYPLTKNTYTFSKISMDGYKVKVVFKETQESITMRLLTQKPWKNILWQSRHLGINDVWYTQTAELYVGTGTYVFNKNLTNQFYNFKNELIGDNTYYLKQDSLIIGPNAQGNDGLRFKIITLTEDSLVIRMLVYYYNSEGIHDPTLDMEDKFTYVHP